MSPVVRVSWKVLAVLLLAGSCIADSVAGVYRWVDEDGRVHFGDRPPVSEAKEVEIREQTPASTVAPRGAAVPIDRRKRQQRMLDVYREEREAKKEAKAKAAAEKQERATRCAYARDRLKSYEGAVIYEPRPDGSRRFLSDSEREREVARVRQAVKRWCD
ncbi:MAG: DUF4124 domain-containing protein [Sedimenticola sp.]